jgi:hypothetical protein
METLHTDTLVPIKNQGGFMTPIAELNHCISLVDVYSPPLPPLPRLLHHHATVIGATLEQARLLPTNFQSRNQLEISPRHSSPQGTKVFNAHVAIWRCIDDLHLHI